MAEPSATHTIAQQQPTWPASSARTRDDPRTPLEPRSSSHVSICPSDNLSSKRPYLPPLPSRPPNILAHQPTQGPHCRPLSWTTTTTTTTPVATPSPHPLRPPLHTATRRCGSTDRAVDHRAGGATLLSSQGSSETLGNKGLSFSRHNFSTVSINYRVLLPFRSTLTFPTLSLPP